jgi:hypothetical protein
LKNKHTLIYDGMITAVQPKQTMDRFVVKGKQVLELCTDIAIDGRPFRLFETTPMKRLIQLAVLGAKETQETITGSKVRENLVDRAKKLRVFLKQRIKGQQVSISADFASLHGNEFLGKLSPGFGHVCSKNSFVLSVTSQKNSWRNMFHFKARLSQNN